MADEKRRLIYELLVEAKGISDNVKKAKAELTDMTQVVGAAKQALGKLFAGFTVGAVVKGFIEVNDEITRITQQLRVFGIQGQAATDAIHAMQDTAIATGASLQSVANAYKDISDVAETLGLTQQEVADLTDAATRAMMAQGGTAEQAAAQIGTLTFAIEKGTITSKELRGVIKENEILQQAFEVALGATTAEILKQADAGAIGAAELSKVLDVYTQLGGEQRVAPTLANITARMIEAGKAFAAGASEASGVSAALRGLGEAASPENADSLRQWADIAGRAFQFALGPATALRLEIEKLTDAQRRAEAERANAAARSTPLPGAPGLPTYSPDERRQAGGIAAQPGETTLQDAFDRAYFEEQQRQGEAVKASRLRNSLENEALATQREILEQRLEITGAIYNEQEITAHLLDEQKLLAEIEADRAKTLDEMLADIAGMKPPELPTDSILEAAEAAQVLAHALQGVFSGATHNARDFFRTLLEGLAEVMLQKAIMNALDSASGSGGIWGSIAKVFMNARGNVFEHGQLVPMASGGVVTGPTMFPLAGGRLGLMGEAGAEAVMPLRRGRDGRLGVSAAVPSIIINNQSGIAIDKPNVIGTDERLEITLRAASLGADMALAEMNRSIRQGYGSTATALARTYGLRRRM